MDTLRVGVIGLQGDVFEHISALRRAFEDLGIKGEAVWVRRPPDLERIEGLVLPGGESTTISKLLSTFGLRDILKEMAGGGAPILGTCAGCVLLAREGDALVYKTRTELLALMDMSVDRNAFGPQRESFEANVDIEGLGSYPGVFIRAPLIKRVWGDCKAIGTFHGKMVLARQKNLLAASFHPELTDDTRFYRMFLGMF
ncbi:MAG: pyridoxal 5'-phosphate synthase glutaminase subunit PdxT [Candidatus Thermoplasmatota archaeon]|nr:pyridoxal 5'-phosphate synthase glutaminase subunit PdxT [Candidatus Thermoplasmatota archaeon]